MTAFLALMRREYLEHRGPYLVAPLLVLALFVAVIVVMIATGRSEVQMVGFADLTFGIFEPGFAAIMGLWYLYLFLTLFFYFSESFTADKRNNAMLFWKSMPQTDLVILMSKMATGMVVFPLMIWIAALVSGLVMLAAMSSVALGVFGGPGYPFDLGASLIGYSEIGLAGFVYFALGIAWFVPYFAWVGALGAVFGRWAIPLAFFIPATIALGEYALFSTWRVWDFLLARAQYGLDFDADGDAIIAIVSQPPGTRLPLLSDFLLSRVNLEGLGLGVLFALVVVWLASEYRRRFVIT